MKQDFDSIIKEYGALLSRVASSYEANPHLQQELLQEISLAVWQALKGFKGDSSIKTYVLRVAHNKAVSHVAYHAKQPFNDSYCEVESPLASLMPGSEQQLSQQASTKALLDSVRALALQPRQIFTMAMEGLSYQEIAQVCGISSGNVGVILNRTKKTLMERMQHER
ncbi:RNA polymerase sigma factor [Aliiglaciecola sp. M165]|uniref:RNA polymerase sigma factor n=1 Tax=Aliiglaciecola sp. M165 TaxID=2593649 RepID=UPI0011810314|nr:sigma-70 family RNA polymerase sigma factor [Aliiglaciecola sp. M165]TRY33369.1 sigma-70 family RNA polymerase sigma factor [Aliiglaciecola sp. M165]